MHGETVKFTSIPVVHNILNKESQIWFERRKWFILRIDEQQKIGHIKEGILTFSLLIRVTFLLEFRL
jgi:hypothetical protein